MSNLVFKVSDSLKVLNAIKYQRSLELNNMDDAGVRETLYSLNLNKNDKLTKKTKAGGERGKFQAALISSVLDKYP